MKLNQIISLALIVIVALSIITGSGCAVIVPPTGGPRDSLPPLLLNVTPADSTRNFTGKKIVLSFDEYIAIDQIQKNLIVSPTPKINPLIESKLRTITINIKDTLQENTTYSVDFGNAIRDINEGNILRNYTYLFSTGKTLDSLELGGKVTVAETGVADSTMIVMLHSSAEDSAVIKDRPKYIARVDSSGNFLFHNLPSATFYIYALKDEGARRYQSNKQLFAFNDSAVTSASQKKDIRLYAFIPLDTSKPKVSTISTPSAKKGNDRALKISTTGSSLDLLSNYEINFISDPIKYFDSTKVILTDDTLIPLKNYSFKRDTSNKKITIVYPWVENTKYNLLFDTLFAEDTSGRRLLIPDTVAFQTKKNSEYGLVKLRFINLQLRLNPVLQFIQGEQVKYSHVFTNNQFNAKLFQPGEYQMRLVYDENKNGLWDTGQFFGERRQPEKVQLIPRKITVKANWDNEIDIQL